MSGSRPTPPPCARILWHRPCNHLKSLKLGGSWVVVSRVISPLIWVTSIVILLITLLITAHEPPRTPEVLNP